MKTTDTEQKAVSPSDAAGGSPCFAFSHNEENYYGKYPSREEAAAAGFEDDDEAMEVWTGECVVPHRRPDADNLIEQVAESTTAESGEWAEDYLAHVSKSARADLQDKLQSVWDEWEKKWDEEPAFFNIENTERHERPESVEENTELRSEL